MWKTYDDQGVKDKPRYVDCKHAIKVLLHIEDGKPMLRAISVTSLVLVKYRLAGSRTR